MDRFFISNEDDINDFQEASSSKNTKLSTSTWVNLYKNWATVRNICTEIHSFPPAELDKILARFYIEVRKEDGNDYEPSCLRVMISALDRYDSVIYFAVLLSSVVSPYRY